jgi:hypothetical protein
MSHAKGRQHSVSLGGSDAASHSSSHVSVGHVGTNDPRSSVCLGCTLVSPGYPQVSTRFPSQQSLGPTQAGLSPETQACAVPPY